MTEVVDFAQYSSPEEALDVWLDLSLPIRICINRPSSSPSSPPPFLYLQSQSPPSTPPQPIQQLNLEALPPTVSSTVHRPSVRVRRNPNQSPVEGEEETIVPPFPWATDRCARVHSIQYLIANGMTSIAGEVECKRCERHEVVAYDLMEKFNEVEGFVRERLATMHERAPSEWMNPVFASCSACAQPNCMRPVLPERKEEYNWLFLFLGQALGICTLIQLKWFCMHTQNHRTGAKDRVLYLSYMTIGNQLDPTGVYSIGH